MVRLRGGENRLERHLGTLAALVEDTDLVPAPVPVSSQPPVTTIPGVGYTLSASADTHAHTDYQAHTHTHKYKKIHKNLK